MNYDPNMTLCGRMAKQTVRVTFAMWDYRYSAEVDVGGNCTGLTVIEAAVRNLNDALDPNYPEITMTREGGDTLLCQDDEDRGEDWLKDMLVAAEIIAIHPEEPQE